MAVKVQKPILVAGLGISGALWLWDSLHDEIVEIGEWGLLGAIAVGGVFWLLKQSASHPPQAALPPSPLKRETVQQAIKKAKTAIAILEAEAVAAGREEGIAASLSSLKQSVAQLPEGFQRQELQLAIAGGKKVGKSSLRKVLEPREIAEDISWVEAEALFTEAEAASDRAKEVTSACDLVLFLVNGDLTESERQFLQQLRASHQRLILAFNKQDRHLPEEREEILQLLQQRLRQLIPAEDAIAIAAAPNPLKVLRHQADGSVSESLEQPPAAVAALEERLSQILTQERETLVWGTIWRQATALQQQAKATLNQVRRECALPAIEQYQWIAAAAAFANPVSALDLLATAAINAQMLVDLSEIYQQKFSFSQAQAAAGTLGKLMVQLGLVELSSQAIAGFLKSNALTYVAGGAIQGISAAYLTRLAGLSLIEYLQEQELESESGSSLNWEKLGAKLKQVFAENQRSAILQGFVRQAIAHLSPEAARS
jgi:GTPase SAR1 family protein